MIHTSDIEADLDSNDTSALENAFRALVDGQQEDEFEGIESADAGLALLARVAQAHVNRDNQRTMPRGLVSLFDGMCEGEEMVMGSSYAAGAVFVLAHLDRWRPLFVKTFEGGR